MLDRRCPTPPGRIAGETMKKIMKIETNQENQPVLKTAATEREAAPATPVTPPLSSVRIPGRGFTSLDLPDVEPWPEPVDGNMLLTRLSEALGRFVLLPKWGRETLALWVMHTYAFEFRDVTTYLGIESP